MHDYGVGILGLGKYLPTKTIDNEQISAWTGTDSQSIIEKLGIRERHLAAEDETASGMSVKASLPAIERADISAAELKLIIGCTYSGDYHFPAMACKIQADIEAWNAGAFDLLANCTSFQVGLSTAAEKMYFDPAIDYSLVVGTALQSRYIDWHDANTAVYCGDGAGAAVLGKVPPKYGVLSGEIIANGRAFEAARLRGGGSSHIITKENVGEKLSYFEMSGLEVWKQVVQWQPKVIKKALAKLGMTVSDVDFFVFHQANLHLIQFLMGKLKIDPKKTYTTVEKYGNTADASLPITLCEAAEQNKIGRDAIVVVSGVGAGFIFGATVMRWYGK